MAALRCAVSRLGGSALQQNRAVIAGRRHILMEQPCAKPAPEHFDGREYAMKQIQQKKEELYNLIAECEWKYPVGRQNGKLLQHLSVQVEPRPNDRQWYSCLRAQRFNECLCFVGVLCAGHVLTSTLEGWWFRKEDPEGNKDISGETSERAVEIDILSDG
uniref:Uncharacterized protein n=1 Tax=Avena sativa TaxID=4498 RepID=A0ACD5UEW8_AVESA